MRTATILAKRHGEKGPWVLLAGPDVPVYEQTQKFRSLKGPRSHQDFAIVRYQESDGHAYSITFMTVAAEQAHDEAREKERAALQAAAKARAEAPALAAKAQAVKRAEKDAVAREDKASRLAGTTPETARKNRVLKTPAPANAHAEASAPETAEPAPIVTAPETAAPEEQS